MTSLLLVVTGWMAATLPAIDTLVLCPPELRPALARWVEMRQQQGRVIHFVDFIDNQPSPERIQATIRELALEHPIRWVLLVGDATADNPHDLRQVARTTPTFLQPAEIIARWGPDRTIATDNPYADLTGDGLPDIAVGRLTADTPTDLAIMVDKILAYESARPVGNWRQQLNFVAGVGGFGGIVDSVLEYTTKRFLTDGIPGQYTTTMTYGSWRSPFSPDPRRFHEVAIDRLNEGCLFWVYLGHGQRRYLDRVHVPGGAFHILGVQDMEKLRPVGPPPIAMFLACYTGAFDEPQDCLAEELLRAPGGPVAVLAGSRVTMPYAMAVFGSSMLHEYFHEKQGTLGELVLHAKRSLGLEYDSPPVGQSTDSESTPHDDSFHASPSATRNRAPTSEENPAIQRQLLDALAAALSPHRDKLSNERREHVELFNLLGDPLLTLRRPETLEVVTNERGTAGSRLEVTLHSQVQGQGTLELVSRRDQAKNQVAARRHFRLEESSLAAMHRDYHRANDQRWLAAGVELNGAVTRLEIEIPEGARGPCYLRCYVAGETGDALGATPIFIHPFMVGP
jgi:hypothetical protein